MNTKPSRRTGLAGVWAHVVAAGIIASSKGRAITARPLLRNVRRGIAFFVKNAGVKNIARSLSASFHKYRRVFRSLAVAAQNRFRAATAREPCSENTLL